MAFLKEFTEEDIIFGKRDLFIASDNKVRAAGRPEVQILLALWLWTNYCISLRLCFCNCEPGTVTPHSVVIKWVSKCEDSGMWGFRKMACLPGFGALWCLSGKPRAMFIWPGCRRLQPEACTLSVTAHQSPGRSSEYLYHTWKLAVVVKKPWILGSKGENEAQSYSLEHITPPLLALPVEG